MQQSKGQATMLQFLRTSFMFLLIVSSFSLSLLSQETPQQPELRAPVEPPPSSHAVDSPPAVQSGFVPSAPVTIPAGTRVLMALQSPLHSTSGTARSGLYLEIVHPVVLENHVVIPAHTQVEGAVASNQRPGHFNRTSEFSFQFTTLIFPNNYVASIAGVLQDIPGSKTTRTRDNGKLATVDQPEKVVVPAAAGGVGGAVLGSVRHFGIGTMAGAGLGAGLGLGSALIKRGDDINLPRGTMVEMVLQAPLTLPAEQAAANARYIAPAGAFAQFGPSGEEEERREPRRQRRGPFVPVRPW